MKIPTPPPPPNSLVVRFAQEPGQLAATRSMLKEVATALGVSENRAVQLSINRLWVQLHGGAEAFDFPPKKTGPADMSQLLKFSDQLLTEIGSTRKPA